MQPPEQVCVHSDADRIALDRVKLYIFRFNQSFGRVLLVLHTTILSMFGKFLVHAWSWHGGLNEEHSRSGSLGAKLI